MRNDLKTTEEIMFFAERFSERERDFFYF